MKKKVLSGIQPSGNLTLGNYLGALKNWVDIQDDYSCRFFVADLHAITVKQDPETLRKNTQDVIAWYLACGIDPEKVSIFVQSHVSAHAELGWVLNCFSGMGEVGRMTQYKEKSLKQESVSVGLFDYPVLMAGDILLYDADFVPVGGDQKQHLELARDIAERMNKRFDYPLFKIPKPFISKEGARIMSLENPKQKMSKSDNNKDACIFLSDSKDVIIKKISKATTDSENIVRYNDSQPGVSNLIEIYSLIANKSIEETEMEFANKNYGYFKSATGELLGEKISQIQKKYQHFSVNGEIERIYSEGCAIAEEEANTKLLKVYDKVGFLQKK